MTYIYKAARHHAPIETEYDTLEDAIERAHGDRESGEAYPKEIVSAAGEVVLNHEQLYARLDSRGGR